MDDTHSARLAARFRDDAQALRARATVLATRGPGQQGHGPSADACRAMADACERVSTLLGGATDDAALGAALPQLQKLLADERSPDVKHVYAGAVNRVGQALGGDDDDPDEDDEDDDDDEEHDDE